jgi:hypothetical protein
MKRIGNLWPALIDLDNLLTAAERARKGKRYRPPVARFHFHLERELCLLHEELAAKTYRPGPYRTFYVYEPKQRLISAAPYRDRVVHHAVTNILGPIFERSFHPDSYACRAGKGTHAAVDRCQQLARRYRYVLKADVRKFFPSMDHGILNAIVARKIKDLDVLWLLGLLVDHGNQEPAAQAREAAPLLAPRAPEVSAPLLAPRAREQTELRWFPGDDLFTPIQRRRGMPLGNQTSQFLANVYLDPLDHFVADRLGLGGYVRYVDDLLVFGNDKGRLAEARDRIADFLAGLRLRLHPAKTVVFPVADGIRFLGYRVFRTHRLLVKENVWRFRRRLRKLQEQYTRNEISWHELRQRVMSWIGHARQADTFRLRERLFAEHLYRGTTTE